MSDNEVNKESTSSSIVEDDSIPIMNESVILIDASRKNNFLSLKDKAEILQRLDEGELASNLAREYGISKSTISRFKKRKETIQEAVTIIFPNNTDRRTMRGTFYKKTEAALYQWYLEQQQRHIEVTSTMLRDMAQIYYNQFEESNYSFCASVGWLTKFKRRYGIQLSSNSQTNTKESLDKKLKSSREVNNPLRIDNVSERILQNVNKKEAIRCLDTVIRWSSENAVDSLYITMLRSLKNQMNTGTKLRLNCN